MSSPKIALALLGLATGALAQNPYNIGYPVNTGAANAGYRGAVTYADSAGPATASNTYVNANGQTVVQTINYDYQYYDVVTQVPVETVETMVEIVRQPRQVIEQRFYQQPVEVAVVQEVPVVTYRYVEQPYQVEVFQVENQIQQVDRIVDMPVPVYEEYVREEYRYVETIVTEEVAVPVYVDQVRTIEQLIDQPYDVVTYVDNPIVRDVQVPYETVVWVDNPVVQYVQTERVVDQPYDVIREVFYDVDNPVFQVNYNPVPVMRTVDQYREVGVEVVEEIVRTQEVPVYNIIRQEQYYEIPVYTSVIERVPVEVTYDVVEPVYVTRDVVQQVQVSQDRPYAVYEEVMVQVPRQVDNVINVPVDVINYEQDIQYIVQDVQVPGEIIIDTQVRYQDVRVANVIDVFVPTPYDVEVIKEIAVGYVETTVTTPTYVTEYETSTVPVYTSTGYRGSAVNTGAVNTGARYYTNGTPVNTGATTTYYNNGTPVNTGATTTYYNNGAPVNTGAAVNTGARYYTNGAPVNTGATTTYYSAPPVSL